MNAVKIALKSRGYTYQDLALELKMTESGVKKLFQAKDISLSRLIDIAEVIKIPVANLVRLAQSDEIEEVILSPKQEDVLLKNPILFRIYWRLIIENQTLQEVQKKEKLSLKDLNTLLIKLERLELLKVGKDKQVRLGRKGLFRWSGEGALVKKLNKEWSELVLERSLRTKKSNLSLHRLSALFLSQNSILELKQELSRIVDDFARRSEREKILLKKESLLPLGLLLAMTPQSFIESDET